MPNRFPTIAAVVAIALLSACSGDVEVQKTDPPADQHTACDALLDALPDTLEDLEERGVSPADALARAWGDPEVVVTCGVDMPSDFDRMSPCEQVNGVGWFVRANEIADADSDLVMTTIGFEPNVRLLVSAEQRPPEAILATVSDAVKQTLTRTGRCA